VAKKVFAERGLLPVDNTTAGEDPAAS
jgi:hypothetical protein